jgi:hypothetical protein
MKDSIETQASIKDQAPTVEIDLILKRVEELEVRFTQLETSLKETVSFDTLAATITNFSLVLKSQAVLAEIMLEVLKTQNQTP